MATVRTEYGVFEHPVASDSAAAFAEAHAQIENLEAALATNRTIGVAIGILIERHKISSDAAFARLVEVSQHTNRKLRDVADELVYTGQIPTGAHTYSRR